MAKCLWCNQSEGVLEEIEIAGSNRGLVGPRTKTVTAHPEHADFVRDYFSRANKEMEKVLLRLVALMFLTIMGVFAVATVQYKGGDTSFWLKILFGPPQLMMILSWLTCPFATPQTIKMLGIRTSMAIIRAFAVISLIILAVWLVFL